MKRFHFFILAVISLQTIFCQSTSYIPFPMDSAAWWANSSFGSYESSSENTYHYFFKSVFENRNGHNYAVLYKEYGGYNQPHNVFPPRIDSSYYAPQKFALLREENKRVYMLLPQDSVESILYDFNLALNDTLTSSGIGSYTFILTNIDSVFIKNAYRKRYTYTKTPPPYFNEPQFDIQIVEGIGTITNHVTQAFDFNSFSNSLASIQHHFLSFCQKDELIYGTSCEQHLPKIIVPYHPFPTANAKWFAYYRDYHDYDTPPTRRLTHCIYTFNGNLFNKNGKDYHAFEEESGTHNYTYYIGYYDSTYQYNGKKILGGFREDAKKVYFWDTEKNEERLLYDFNIAKGDSFYYEGRKFWVADTFAQAFVSNGEYYKTYSLRADSLNSFNVFTLIEGIGSKQFAPHLPYIENHIYDNNFHLVKDQLFDAFCTGETLLIKEGFVTDCNTEIFNPNVPLFPKETLFPNPVSEKMYVYLSSLNGEAPKIEIFDMIGNQISSIALQSKEVEIDVRKLPTGIYVVRYISTSEQRFIGKMLVKR